jgi:alkylhydroperoxidase family enzyme
VTAADIAPLRAVSLSDEAIEDAIQVCALFNIYDRVADAFGFDVPERAAFDASAVSLLRRGYAT